MLSSLFNIIAATRTTLGRIVHHTAQAGAVWVCPGDRVPDLRACYHNASVIRQQILHMTAHPTPEVGFLRDFFEVTPVENLGNFARLMAHWAAADRAFPPTSAERRHFPRSFRVTAEASQFNTSYQRLSLPTQWLLNYSLSPFYGAMTRVIAQKAEAFVRHDHG